MLCELTGKVKKVCKEEVFASGFKKRSLIVVEGDENTKYPATLAIDFTKDKTALLDKVSAGDEVSVRFGIGGREWTDPKTNAVRYFTSLNGVSVKVAGGGKASKTPPPAVPTNDTDMGGDDPDDIPF